MPLSSLKKHILSLLVISLAACSSSDGDDKSTTESSAELSGRSVKGVIKNGQVKAYGVNQQGSINRSAVLGSALTSSVDGTYSLTINNYTGVVVIEVTALADGTSTMVCDLPGENSCGTDIDFGDEYTLGSDFALQAVIPSVGNGDEITTNVTALTHMAAALAAANGINTESAAYANAQVAALLEITGDITTLPTIDITNQSEVEGADGEALEAAVKAAALLAASMSGEVENGLDTVIEDFINNYGQLVQTESSGDNVTLEEILAAAAALLNNEMSSFTTGSLSNEINTELTNAQSGEDGALTDAEADIPVSDSVQAAMNMVADLRDLTAAATLSPYEDAATLFADELEAVELLNEADTDVVFDALSSSLAAIGEAVDYVNNQETPESPYVAENGISVSFTGNSYNVDIDTSDINVSVNASAIADIDETEDYGEVDDSSIWTESWDNSANIKFNASITAGNVTLTVEPKAGDSGHSHGGMVSGSAVGNYTETCTNTDSAYSCTTEETNAEDGLAVFMNATLSMTGENAATLKGLFDIELTGVESAYNSEYGWEEGENYWQDSSAGSGSDTFETLDITFKGNISNSNGNETDITLSVSADNNNGFAFESTDSYEYGCTWEAGYINYDCYDSWNETENEESNTNWVDLSFSLNLTVALAGIDDETEVSISATRTELENADVNVELAFNGKRLAIVPDKDTETITITNQAGLVLELQESGEEDVSGTIKQGSETLATISNESGITLVRYKDGRFESFE